MQLGLLWYTQGELRPLRKFRPALVMRPHSQLLHGPIGKLMLTQMYA